MEKWTLNDMPGLTGKVVIVTGGNSGLGYESVKALAGKGAEVILASRSLEKGKEAKDRIGNVPGKIIVMQLDLADFDSVKGFAAEFSNKYRRLDVLLNNAGIMISPYFLTKDGLEGQNGINHFGHFALTGQLIGLLKSTPGSRIVNVSSNAHKYGSMDFENLLFENGKGYSPLKSYSRSKLANLLFTYELQRKLSSIGSDTIAVASHPGASKTNLVRYVEGKWWFKLLTPLTGLMAQDAAQGALPQIRAAVDPNVRGGEYYGPHKGMKGYPVLVSSNSASHNEEDAKKLWEVSEKITGVHYN
jgi:NAD(P)-dependent dehydrogenase (short-subunit alcohol dehydrogenase family)